MSSKRPRSTLPPAKGAGKGPWRARYAGPLNSGNPEITGQTTPEAHLLEVKVCTCSRHEGDNPVPLPEMRRDRRRSDGYGSWCLTCERRACRERKQRYRQDPERLADLRAQDRATKRAMSAQAKAATYQRRKDRYRSDPEYRQRMCQAAAASYRKRQEVPHAD